MSIDPTQHYPEVSFGECVQILGIAGVTIGAGTCIGDGSWLNVCNPEARMTIGRTVLIGRYSMLSTAGTFEIGDFTILAPRVFVSDADHVVSDIYQPILQQGATEGREIVVEENCWLGINTVITGNLRVERCSIVAANSVVRSDVPAFSIVAGAPARLVKMFDPVTEQWESVGDEEKRLLVEAHRTERPLPDRETYRQILRERAAFHVLDPILAGRGVSR